MRRSLRSNGGFTIMEALVAAVVFMAGFSIMVALLSSTLAKLSSRELILAANVARGQMIETIATRDTTALDTFVTLSGTAFELKRRISFENRLAQVRLIVSRRRTGKELVDLYSEFAAP